MYTITNMVYIVIGYHFLAGGCVLGGFGIKELPLLFRQLTSQLPLTETDVILSCCSFSMCFFFGTTTKCTFVGSGMLPIASRLCRGCTPN